jgi:VIT1/CCC1 family predicted Fe2+/Mn2+ transporter
MKYNKFYRDILHPKGRPLDPVSRISEVVFGLIMVLTFTGTISVASQGREEIGLVLLGALSCNIAWGIVDAMMYIMSVLIERGNALKALQIRAVGSQDEAYNIIKDYLPAVLARVITPGQLKEITQELQNLPEPPKKAPITSHDVKGAIAVFILVFLSTFPATIPFLIIKDVATALIFSHAIAITLLFITGFYLGKHTGYNSWILGIITAVIGILLVLMTIALGG